MRDKCIAASCIGLYDQILLALYSLYLHGCVYGNECMPKVSGCINEHGNWYVSNLKLHHTYSYTYTISMLTE